MQRLETLRQRNHKIIYRLSLNVIDIIRKFEYNKVYKVYAIKQFVLFMPAFCKSYIHCEK